MASKISPVAHVGSYFAPANASRRPASLPERRNHGDKGVTLKKTVPAGLLLRGTSRRLFPGVKVGTTARICGADSEAAFQALLRKDNRR